MISTLIIVRRVQLQDGFILHLVAHLHGGFAMGLPEGLM